MKHDKYIIEILPGQLRAVSVSKNNIVKTIGEIVCEGLTNTAIRNGLKTMQKDFPQLSDPRIILPESGLYVGGDSWTFPHPTISRLEALARWNAADGSFKKPGIYVLLHLGSSVQMALIEKSEEIEIGLISLDRMVADFQEAVSEPHSSRYLQDFCSDMFFLRKDGRSAAQLHAEMEKDASVGAELFVEYGAHIGALLANLDLLFNPDCISITGPLAELFDAWSHAMGKARNMHRGEKPHCRVNVLKAKEDSAVIGAASFNL